MYKICTGLNMYMNMYIVFLYRFVYTFKRVQTTSCTCSCTCSSCICTGSCTGSNMYNPMYMFEHVHCQNVDFWSHFCQTGHNVILFFQNEYNDVDFSNRTQCHIPEPELKMDSPQVIPVFIPGSKTFGRCIDGYASHQSDRTTVTWLHDY